MIIVRAPLGYLSQEAEVILQVLREKWRLCPFNNNR